MASETNEQLLNLIWSGLERDDDASVGRAMEAFAVLKERLLSAKVLAWRHPRIIRFKAADGTPLRTDCPPDQQHYLEGEVSWEASILQGPVTVTDKHGRTHSSIPLYAAPVDTNA